MIPIPPGWTVTAIEHGLALVHPDGIHVAAIRYRDRLRPLVSVEQLIAAELPAVPGYQVFAVGATERLVTHEGEHAAFVTTRGRVGERFAQRDFGYVFGDDYYAEVIGICLDEAIADQVKELVRELVCRDAHGLGVLRRRRFEYTPPPGWQPLVQGLATEWIPPGYPNDRSSILVLPAEPRAGTRQRLDESISPLRDRGYTVRAFLKVPLTVGELAGESVVVTAAKPGVPVVNREVIALADQKFIYLMELTSQSANWLVHRNVVRELANSVHAVPTPTVDDTDLPQPLIHWAE